MTIPNDIPISISVYDKIKSNSLPLYAESIPFYGLFLCFEGRCNESIQISCDDINDAKLYGSTCYITGRCQTDGTTGRGKAHTYSQSCLVIDYDGDDSVNALVIINELTSLKIMAIVHESWSSKNNNRFRVIIPYGFEVFDHAFKVQAANFVINQLSFGDFADECSFKWYQLMLPPMFHVHSQPNIWFVHGDALVTFIDEIELEKFETQLSQDTVIASTQGMVTYDAPQSTISKADELFNTQVNNRHKSLQFDSRAGGSLRYRRCRDDKGAGCYITDEGRAIKDNKLDYRGKSKYHLVTFSPQEFQQALAHQPITWLDWGNVTESKIRNLMENGFKLNFKAIMHTNAGRGKSRLLQRFSKDNPLKQRYVFTFHTTSNLKVFVRRCAEQGIKLQVVLGNTDIVCNYRDFSDNEIKAIKGAFSKLYDPESSEKVKRQGFKRVIASLSFLSGDDINNLLVEYHRNRDAIHSRDCHLVMSTAKFKSLIEYSYENNLFIHDVIFQDEMTLGEFTNADDAIVDVWNSEWKVPKNKFPRYLQYIKRLRMCFLTAELAPVLEMKHQGFRPDMICQPHHILESNLEVLIVPKTNNDSGHGASVRSLITDQASEYFDETIVDGVGHTTNHVSSKGCDNLKVGTLCAIVSDPHPLRIAETVVCTGLEVEEAHVLLMSDTANQAVGRNTGYRGSPDRRCLLIMPKGRWLALHNITSNVYSYSTWNASSRTRNLPKKTKARALFGEFFDSLSI